MKRYSTLLLCIIFSTLAWGQARKINGNVQDSNGAGLAGVTVLAPGTNTGTNTDIDGNFSIQTDARSLRFVYTGYESLEIEVGASAYLSVVLKEKTLDLDQLVVVAYGTQRKKEITSAVVVVDQKAIRDRPMVSAAEALQGKAAGVQVVQPSGKPGADISVRVRGATSVLAGNEPLYVVDGVPTTDIRGINPGDIESMTILKDASSAAIYGARAANGVILINTKRGADETSTIQLNLWSGVSRLRKTVETLSTKKYRELMDEIIPGSLDPTATAYTNWSDETFGWGQSQSYQLSYAGGSSKTRHFASMNYLNSSGIVRPARFDRYSLRLNLDNQLRSWFKLGTNLNVLYSNTFDTPDNASSGRGGVIMSALNTPPFLQVYKKDGSGQYDPNPFQPSWENPVAYMEGPDQKQHDGRVFGNLNAEFDLIKGLKFKSNFGIDLNNQQWDWYLDPFKTNFGRNQNGSGRSNKINYQTWLLENILQFNHTKGNHNFGILAGNSLQQHHFNGSYISGNDFPANTSVKTLNAANSITASTQIREWALASFFGRLTYDYQSKYLFTASLRRDGSSKLAHHWGTMPAFSAGWRISEEAFLKRFKALDDLKIRVGWGKNGNQEGIGDYAHLGLTNYFRRTTTDPLSGPAEVQVSYGNPDLRWETTAQTNVGLDLTLWKGRLNFSTDAYFKKTADVLLNVQLPNTLPISSIQTNAGEIENKGIDFNLASVNTTSGLQWRTEFNVSLNRNKVIALQYTDVYYFGRIYSNNADVAIVKEGLPLGSFFGYISEGVDPETGDIKYKDVNENGIFDPRDRTVIGNANPDFTYGLTNTLTWRRFDLNLFLQGSQGNDVYNATRIDLEGMFDSKNQSVSVLRRWTPDNRNTDIPRAIGGGKVDNVRNSSRFVEDGSYLRLKSVTLSYQLNVGRMKNMKLRKFSCYITGQNLLTLTKYSGFDPEVNAFGRSATELGIDYGTYPQARTLVAGINIEF